MCLFAAVATGGYSAAAADTASLAMDYRLVGFRECAAEVSRYLVSIEGLDLQDPLRLRLISHLQCYGAQRESGKACAPPAPPPHPWNQHHHHHQYAPPPPGPAPMHNTTAHHAAAAAAAFDQPSTCAGSSYLEALGRGGPPQHVDGMRSALGGANASQLAAVHSPATSTPSQPSAASLLGVHHATAAQFLGAAAMNSAVPAAMLSPNGLHYGSSAAAAAMLGQGVKPYRPWGAELVY